MQKRKRVSRGRTVYEKRYPEKRQVLSKREKGVGKGCCPFGQKEKV